MARQKHHSRAHRGFTLLELLIVLVIFGLIMSALTQGALFARKAWNTQERIIDKQGDLLSLQNFLRQLLQSGKSFKGDGDSLQFEGKLPRVLSIPGSFDIDLHLKVNRLILAWRPHTDTIAGVSEPPKTDGAEAKSPAEPGMTETELAQDISGLTFSYYFKASKHQMGGWQNLAQDLSKPPVLIKLALAINGQDLRRWPSLVVAPRIDEANLPKS